MVRTSAAIACFALSRAFLSSDIGCDVHTMAMFSTVGTWFGFIGLHDLGRIVLFVAAILASVSIDTLAVGDVGGRTSAAGFFGFLEQKCLL